MRNVLAMSLTIAGLLLSTNVLRVSADEVSATSSSSSSTTDSIDVKQHNLKYGERVKNWGEQIDMGISKGWLTADEASTFKTRLDGLRQLNDSISAKGYPRAEQDDMEKQFNTFNIDLSTAASKPKTAAAPAPAAEKPATKVCPPNCSAGKTTVKKAVKKH